MFIDLEYCTLLKLEGFKPKPNTETPGQEEAAKYLFGSRETDLRLGVWECTPGRFNVTRTTSELCKILTGRVTLHAANGERQEHGSGALFCLPAGCKGTWEIHERVRKVFVVYDQTVQFFKTPALAG